MLEELLRRRPDDAAGLLAIKGIGQSFVAKHGDAILAELRPSLRMPTSARRHKADERSWRLGTETTR